MKLLLILLSNLGLAYANPPTSTLELEEGFYKWDCNRGYLSVFSSTYECPETGLFRMTAKITVSGRTSEVELHNSNLCKESLWITELPHLVCTNESKNSRIERIKVYAHVDPVLWKEALGK